METIVEIFEDLAKNEYTFTVESDGSVVSIEIPSIFDGTLTLKSDGTFTYERE